MNHTGPFGRGADRTATNGQHSKTTHSRSHTTGDRIQYPGTCTAVIGSMTQTMKAQNALATASIRAAITKISSTKTQSGCVYGLDFPCCQTSHVQQILADQHIAVRQYLGGV